MSEYTVYGFCNAKWLTDEVWIAVAEDGEILAQHISSSRSFGMRDVGLDGFYGYRYQEKYGQDYASLVRYVVLPEDEKPPAEVLERSWEAVA